MVLYTKKGQFVTKLAYVQDKILPQPQNFTQACFDVCDKFQVTTKIIVEKNNGINRTLPLDEYDCDHCQEDFETVKLHKGHIYGCPICGDIFSEYPYCLLNHIGFTHEELYCDHCTKCFTKLEDMKHHGESCFKCENCNNFFLSKRQLKQQFIRKLEEAEENCAEEISKKRRQYI